MAETAKRVRVHGMVTGVGFRYATLREAARYPGLKGYVRNMDARTVECVLQGPPEEVEAMVRWLQHGPPSARVLSREVADLPVRPERPPFRMTR